MKKILIVDDEYIVRIGIKSILNWEQYGYKVVGEADNGSVAIEKIKLLQPDIVLTDIKMPIMDGLALIKTVREVNKNIQFVILSGYNDFETVKTAMKLGAVDYIFKLEVNPDELVSILNEIEVASSDVGGKDTVYIKEVIHKMTHLPFKCIKQDECNYLFQQLHIESEEDCVKITLISIVDYWSLVEQGESDVIKFAVINLANEIVDEMNHAITVELEGSYLAIFYENNTTEEEIHKSLSKLSHYVYMYLNLYIGYIRVETNLVEFKSNIIGAMDQIKERFWLDKKGDEVIISHRKIAQKVFDTQEFKNCIYHADMDGAIEEVNHLVSILYETCTTIEDAREKLMVIYGVIKGCCEDNFDVDCIEKTEISLYDAITKCDFLFDIKSNFITYLSNYRELLKVNKVIKKAEVLEAQKYIRKNISSALSVYEIAQYIGMNESYFSSLFKKETGENITEYIQKLRIKLAKELLRTTTMKVYEIANEVGIENPNYFSSVFKKCTGMTIQEYKRKIQDKERYL